jgi:radical SAM superfamily enzyme YgiQ (UPF0313 family)
LATKESLPLAAGYLKASVLADDELAHEVDVEILNFRGRTPTAAMVRAILGDRPPAVLAFSVFGWNVRQFATLSSTYKQMVPHGLVIWGGTHVAHQGPRVFAEVPSVDVVADGEGEIVFPQLLKLFLRHGHSDALWAEIDSIPGLTWRLPGGEAACTGAPVRIDCLDEIPSPFLTGAIELRMPDGQFRFDVALIETNRGCPYKCSFCYWGGAVGQRVREFDRERLREEVALFAAHEVDSLILCDANFGMRKADEDFIDDVIGIRRRTGFPRHLDTSWAKNKSTTFFNVVRKMKECGLHSSFTLALQSLDDPALRTMRRRNMQVNDWHELVAWMQAEHLDCYAELLWGAPGETVEAFVRGYNELSRHTSRIAVYPVLVLPNTDFQRRRDELGIVSVRGEADDFEYVLQTDAMSLTDNLRMQPFLLLARTLGENMILRALWRCLDEVASLPQGSALVNLARFVTASRHPTARALSDILSVRVVIDSDAVAQALRLFYEDHRMQWLLDEWLTSLEPIIEAKHRPLVHETLRYDWLTRPLLETASGALEGLVAVERPDGLHYARRNVRFEYPFSDLVGGPGAFLEASPSPRTYTFLYRDGFSDCVDSHELAAHFLAEVTDEQVIDGS